MNYNFDEVIDRRNGAHSYSYKWLANSAMNERFNMDVNNETIAMFTADMDFRCAPPILDAIRAVADHGILGYSSLDTSPEYFDAVSGWFKRKYDWDIKRDEVVYINGTVEALFRIVEAFTKEGDGVIIQRPVYGPFSRIIESNGRKLVDNRLINDGNGYYTMDFEDLRQKAADPNNKLMLLCSPHNPVGRIWNEDELKQLADICAENDVIIAADEIHGDLVRAGQQFRPMATIARDARLITATAVNKTFNLAGLHCTNLIIQDDALRRRFMESYGGSMPSPFTIAATIAAYTQCDEWLQQLNAYIDGNIDWALSFITDKLPKLKCQRPEGTYLLWLDFSGYGLSEQQLHERIYRKANVLLENGTVYDPDEGGQFQRICLPSPRSVVQTAFERIADQF